MQNYPHWHATYINDCSTDRTGQFAEEFIDEHHLRHKFTVVHNKKRRGALANTYRTIKKAHPNHIIVIVDGDDKLADANVFSYVAQLYKNDPNLWLTYGSYDSQPIPRRSVCSEFPKHIIKHHDFRHYKYVTGHLRTFCAGLFQQIKKKDLLENGRFLPSAGDVATMIPMMEMAVKGHYLYVKKLLYIYNDGNPINDYKNQAVQRRCSLLVRSRSPYKPLKRAVWQ
jgi:glycosyltransferase involved in cell wall biosynthesis